MDKSFLKPRGRFSAGLAADEITEIFFVKTAVGIGFFGGVIVEQNFREREIDDDGAALGIVEEEAVGAVTIVAALGGHEALKVVAAAGENETGGNGDVATGEAGHDLVDGSLQE